jgi:hypothetical protein
LSAPFDSTVNIVALVAGSSVLAAVVTQGLSALRDRRKTNKDAAFSALYMAIAFESYANECASLIGDSENYDSSHGAAGKAHGNLPLLPPYPEEVEWKPFGLKRTTRALSFRTEVDSLRAMISDHWDFLDEDDIVPVVREEAAELGAKALGLAAELRRDWYIEPLAEADDWSVQSYLRRKKEEYEKARKLREERNRQSNADLLDNIPDPVAAKPDDPPDVVTPEASA